MKYICLLLCSFFVLTFTACEAKKAPEPSSIEIESLFDEDAENITIIDIFDKIYEDSKVEGIKQAKDDEMEDIFGFDISIIDEYYVRYSSKNYGLADVFVIKTSEDNEQQVFETLTKIKDDRVQEFENYIIYDSLNIAKNAEIYTKGDYVIMLMIENQDDAKKLIDSFLTEDE